jgi:dTDP-4-amino-4,6-dideoxygalactose transaminase
MTNRRPIPFVDLGRQYATIRDEVHAAIDGVLTRGDFILGKGVADFEEAFAAKSGAAFGIGVDSGTSALELALRAYGIGPGDEVITQANSFIATALAISHSGATPVLVDADPETYMIPPKLIRRAITPKTKAIMPVHLYGHPADMDAIMAIATEHDLIVIEDASQAHTATYRGQPVGSIGHAGAFSLYPAKNLGAYGDAGIIVTNDPEVAERLRLLRNYGSVKKYYHDTDGFNRRMDTMQAEVLSVKLRYLDEWTTARRSHAARYSELLSDLGAAVKIPSSEVWADPVYHLYVIEVDDRDGLQQALSERGIGTVIHYPVPIHQQKAYAALGHVEGDFPVTDAAARRVLSLPMFAEITDDEIVAVVEAVRELVSDEG